MKNLSILAVSTILIGLLCKTGDFTSNMVEYFIEDYQVHIGVMEFSNDKKTIYLTGEKDSRDIKLEFAYDNVEDLVIDDMGIVKVTGYYSKVHRVLFVEDIITSDWPLL